MSLKNRNWKKGDPWPDTSLKCGPGKTKQEFKDEVDVNSIMAKYRRTGLISHVRANPGTYADLTGLASYHESLNKVAQAQELFLALPATIRGKFENDPAKMVAFMEDESNHDEARKLGMLPPKPAPAREPVKDPAPAKEDAEPAA